MEQDEEHYHRHATTGTRRHPSCKKCRTAERRARYERSRHTAHAQMRAYYAANGENLRVRIREWKQQHRQDPEYVQRETAFNREWRRRNPHKMAAANARQRARGRFLPDWTAEEWQQLLDEYGHRCLACGCRGPLQPDHVIPLSWPGAGNGIDNIQPLCGTCNRRRGDRHIDYRVKHSGVSL